MATRSDERNKMSNGKRKEKVVLVTGGNSGIGLATARRLSATARTFLLRAGVKGSWTGR